jgi:hypothetical protein
MVRCLLDYRGDSSGPAVAVKAVERTANDPIVVPT